MSDNISVLLVGSGYMASEYCRVFSSMGVTPVVVGRSEKKCSLFAENCNMPVYSGGLKANWNEKAEKCSHAIVATSIDQLFDCTVFLLSKGIRNILVEKPAGLSTQDVLTLKNMADEVEAKVFVAYNRRFYQSTQEARRIISQDGGLRSIHFEFTEWESDILRTIHDERVRQNILLANSSHVIDLAFFLAGRPQEFSAFVADKMDWHRNGRIYAGAGYTVNSVVFSYNANWGSPGRWSIECMTDNHRLYFKPMERLGIQYKDSVDVEEADLDYSIDERFKPGLFYEVRAFFYGQTDDRLTNICEHADNMRIYEKIAGLQTDSVRVF